MSLIDFFMKVCWRAAFEGMESFNKSGGGAFVRISLHPLNSCHLIQPSELLICPFLFN